MAVRSAAGASRDAKGFGCKVESHSLCKVRRRSSSSSSSDASVSFSAKAPGGLPPWATKIANAKATMYSGRIRMLLTKYFRRTFPGMVSTLYLFGVMVPSGSVPSRITSRFSNNFASEAGLAHAQSQSCFNDANVSSERLRRIICQRDVRKKATRSPLSSLPFSVSVDMSERPEVRGKEKELLTHPHRSLERHCRFSVALMDFPSLGC